MATARPGTPGAPGTPRPEQPTAESRAGTAALRRTRSLPEELGVPLPPRCLSPVTPLPPGEPPAPEIPPDALAVTADLRRLTRRAAGEDNRRLPPLLASLARRTRDPRLPVTPRRWAPTPPRLPAPRAAAPWASPNRLFAEEVTLRPHPPLCRDAGGDAAPDPLDVRELYRELYRELDRTFPAERLRFHREPLVEPAAAVADLLPAEPQNAGEPPRRGDGRGHGQRQTVGLFDDYLSFVAATGSDFLGAIFHRDGEEAVGAPWLRREPAAAPAEPSEGVLRVPKHRGDNKRRQRGVGGWPPSPPGPTQAPLLKKYVYSPRKECGYGGGTETGDAAAPGRGVGQEGTPPPQFLSFSGAGTPPRPVLEGTGNPPPAGDKGTPPSPTGAAPKLGGGAGVHPRGMEGPPRGTEPPKGTQPPLKRQTPPPRGTEPPIRE